VAPLAIAENLDVLLNRRFGVSTRDVALMMNQFLEAAS